MVPHCIDRGTFIGNKLLGIFAVLCQLGFLITIRRFRKELQIGCQIILLCPLERLFKPLPGFRVAERIADAVIPVRFTFDITESAVPVEQFLELHLHLVPKRLKLRVINLNEQRVLTESGDPVHVEERNILLHRADDDCLHGHETSESFQCHCAEVSDIFKLVAVHGEIKTEMAEMPAIADIIFRI